MKFTPYFLHVYKREDRKWIKIEWIEALVTNPISEEHQQDGRIRRWGKIADAGDRYLRVVLLEDGETVHNAFFDRMYNEG